MIATIEHSIMPGAYLVKDKSGRKYRVHSPEFWRRGESVQIADGHIIGKAVSQPVTTTVEV